MLVATEGQVQASVTRMHYSGGVTSATILCVTDHEAWQVPVTLCGLPQRAAAGYVGALARLMAGAVVMDGADLMAIQDSLDNARRVA